MFEVVCTPTGDRAEADDPESARLAALTLLADARDHGAGTPLVAFYADGKLVRRDLNEAALR